MIANLFKAAIAVAVTPISVVVDVLTLPSSAYEDRSPFGNTAGTISQAREAINAALKPHSN